MKKFFVIVLFLITTILYAQTPNDCVNAITICGNGVYTSNSEGIGNVQEVSGCSGQEHNSIWLKINVVQSGTLGFHIKPIDTDILVDYDFWVYGPNRACNNLGSPIRCATTNPNLAGATNNYTGMYGATTATTAGPGAQGNSYVRWLTVSAGQSYYIAIDRPEGDGGFELEWIGTATENGGAFATSPTANQIQDMVACSSTPNISIFDLNSIRTNINADITNNTITFHETLENALDNIAPLGDIIGNSSNPQTIYARVTNNFSGCHTLTQFNLRVSPLPTATISASETNICAATPTTITIHATPNSVVEYSKNGTIITTNIDASGEYIINENLTENTTFTLNNVKILGANNVVICSKTLSQSILITVEPSITPTFNTIAPICSGENLDPLPTTSLNGITGVWSPAINNTLTTNYTFTPDAQFCASIVTLQVEVLNNIIPNFTQVAPICQGEILSELPLQSPNGVTGTWSPAINQNATTTYTFTPNDGQCSSIVTMQIEVLNTIIPTFTPVNPICAGEILNPLPTTSLNGIAGSWSPALNNLETTTYTFTPTVVGCYDVTTLEIVVNPIIVPVFNPIAPICFGENLDALPTTSLNGITGSWSPALNNTATTNYTFTPNPGICAQTISQTIQVNSNPILAVNEYTICNENASGIAEFDLISQIPTFLGSTQNPNNFTVSFYKDAAATDLINSNSYTNESPNNQTIYIQITNSNTGCTSVLPITLIVLSGSPVTQPTDFYICDEVDGIYIDGIATFNLLSLNDEILNGQNPNDFLITYHTQAYHAQMGIHAISNPEEFRNQLSSFSQTLHIRVQNITQTSNCIGLTTVNLHVTPVLKSKIITGPDNINTICVNFETGIVERTLRLFSHVQGANYSYQWFLNGVEIIGATDNNYLINTASPGMYTVAITDTISNTNCNSLMSDPFEVIQSGSASVSEIIVSDEFQNNQTITIIYNGFGEYWFQLNDGPIENNQGLFTNVRTGIHTITIYDRKGGKFSCKEVVLKNIAVINYPKFFTPNADGYNDTWNISSLKDTQPNANIYIFDRYSKLITKITPSSPGWDGTLNQHLLPATDYWFHIYYEKNGEPKEFKSHFTLKR